MGIKYIIVIVLPLIVISCGPHETFDVFVSDGLRPTISWDYGKVTHVTVRDITLDSSRVLIWSIHGNNWGNKICSPIVYGINPDTLNITVDVAVNDSTSKLIFGNKYIVGVSCGPAEGYREFIATE